MFLTRNVPGSDPSPKEVFMIQSYQAFVPWLQSHATLPSQDALYPVAFIHFTHYKRKCNPSMHNFILAILNGSYRIRLHKVAIIRVLLCILEAQRGYHNLQHSLQYITL